MDNELTNNMKNTSYHNEKMSVSFHSGDGMGRDYISYSDLTDHYNDTKGFTKKVRNIKHAWAFIEQIMQNERLKDDLKMFDIVHLLDEKFNLSCQVYLSCHVYCGMD